MTRSSLVKSSLAASRAIVCLACVWVQLASAGQQKPNIVLFLADDLGWQDTSVPFYCSNGVAVVTPLNRKFHTPSMERLASEGVKFTSAYACSVCSPSRVSLMTGLNAARHRVTNWTLRKDAAPDGAHPRLKPPAWNVNGISPDPSITRAVCAPTLPRLLREAGYHTIHVGKAHFGAIGTPGADPRNIGFDVNIAGHAAGGPGSYLGEQNYSASWRKGDSVWDVPGLEKYHGTETFLTEALTLEAVAAVERAAAHHKPFFLYLSHYAVHVPFAKDKRFYQKYRDAGLDDVEAMYAGIVEGMDKSLGDVLACLDRLGLATNTVVLFMSDNGGLSAHGRSGTPHTHNAPLSSGKGSAREGGIREPMLVRWPGITRSNSVCAAPILIEDFFPTILEIAGAKAQLKAVRVDGRSFLPQIRGGRQKGNQGRALYWHYPNVWGPTGPGIEPYSSIRKGDWKLIYYYDGPRIELFNIAHDIGESTNLAQAEPGQTRRLTAALRRWLRDVNAQMPSEKQTGAVVLPPDAHAVRCDN